MVVENLSRTKNAGDLKMVYFYRLVKSSIDIAGDWQAVSLQSYGIEIERQDILGDKLINICRDCIKTISPDRYKVHKLIKLLYDYNVSPIHLVDVIGDYVDKYILDFDKQIETIVY
ncbi:DUF6514 family protein [Clostridium sp.]|jgi:hypothetical protein|uniref:DUF6514 family protein n=1 Tax=Clostridium sp. TaxID=1506 RepID=UPI003A5BC078